jgi:hypothetical protein
MFGRGLTRLQPAYVEAVAEAIGRTMQRAETPSTIFEFGGPRVYSYEEFLGAVAHEVRLAPRLIPIPFAVWHALAWTSEMFPSPLLTRNQVELMQIDTVASTFTEVGGSKKAEKDARSVIVLAGNLVREEYRRLKKMSKREVRHAKQGSDRPGVAAAPPASPEPASATLIWIAPFGAKSQVSF